MNRSPVRSRRSIILGKHRLSISIVLISIPPNSFISFIHSHDRLGHYIALFPKNITTLSTNNEASFYSPMWTSSSRKHCRMRFFFFINGAPENITQTTLKICIRYASKFTRSAIPIQSIKLDVKGDLQQRWIKSVVEYDSAEDPFQFVFVGHLGDSTARIAVDDVTYDTNCIPSQVARVTSAPTTIFTQQPASSQSNSITPKTLTTSKPVVISKKQEPNKSSGRSNVSLENL